MSKVLVLGGSGFLGSYVVDELLARGHGVTLLDREKSRFHPSVPIVLGDLRDSALVRGAVAGHEVVYNFAGLADLNASIDNPRETVELNVLGNLNVLEACRAEHVQRFVYASTVYVFSTKGAFYGASKKCSEIMVEEYSRQYGLAYTIVRYGSVYGHRAGASNRVYRLLRQALTERKVTFRGDGSEEREYIHGRDAAKLTVDILGPEFANRHVILTGAERHRYRDVLKLVQEIVGNDVRIELEDQDYRGHYHITPYTFAPSVGTKLIANPFVDFGQGVLECVETLYRDLGLAEDLPPM